MSDFEKLLQLERTRIFPYCGKLNLSQNFPNPVRKNEKSLISYRAIDVVSAEIVVYELTGKIVFTRKVTPGVGEVEIHGGQLKPGKYYYVLMTNGRRMFKKELTILDS